jgi:hypothetical protein
MLPAYLFLVAILLVIAVVQWLGGLYATHAQ